MAQDIFGKAYKTKNGDLFYPCEVSVRDNETTFYGITFDHVSGAIAQRFYESELTRSEENDMVKVKQ